MNDENSIKEAIRKHYLDLLNKKPDELGMNHFIELIKNGKMKLGELVDTIKNSQEYKYSKLVKLRNYSGNKHF